MRAHKVLVVVVALIACLGVGSVAVATAKTKKKIQTAITVTVASANPGPYTQASAKVFGNVSAKGPKGCTGGRTVVILRNGVLVATVVTGASGEYSTTLQGVSSGNYQAGVEQRVIKRKHKKFICKLAATTVVVIPGIVVISPLEPPLGHRTRVRKRRRKKAKLLSLQPPGDCCLGREAAVLLCMERSALRASARYSRTKQQEAGAACEHVAPVAARG